MNHLIMLRNLFKNKSQDSTEKVDTWNEAYNAYEQGKKLYFAKKYLETGYPPAAAYYEKSLITVQMEKEFDEENPDAWQRRLERNLIHRRKEPNLNSQL